MILVGFVIGTVVATSAAMLIHLLMERQRSEYRKAIARRDSDILKLEQRNCYMTGYKKARELNSTDMIGIMVANQGLRNKVKRLEKEVADLNRKLADSGKIVEVQE